MNGTGKLKICNRKKKSIRDNQNDTFRFFPGLLYPTALPVFIELGHVFVFCPFSKFFGVLDGALSDEIYLRQEDLETRLA